MEGKIHRGQARAWPVAGILTALALFFSGPLSLFTPLPFLFQWVTGRTTREVFMRMGLVSSAFILCVYALLFWGLHDNYQNHPWISWVVVVPGIGFSELMGVGYSCLLGVGFFAFYLLLAYFLWKSFLAFHRLNQILLPFMLISFLAAIGFVIYASYANGHDLVSILENDFMKAADQFLSTQASQQNFSADQIAYFKTFAMEFVKLMVSLSPSFFLIGLMMIVLCNLLVALRFFNPLLSRLGQMILNRWTLSFHYVWIFIALGSVFWANYYFIKMPEILTLTTNGLLILGFLYFLQGLAIVGFFFENKGFPFFLRLTFYLFVFFMFQAAAPLLAAFGFFDAWLDLRKINKQEPPVAADIF